MTDQAGDEVMRAIDISPEIAHAHNIIAETWALKQNCSQCSKLFLTTAQYKALQQYRSCLGDLNNPAADYISEYTLFGLEIYIDVHGLRVE